ncbi:MAG TPA: bifunctional DNA-formamidopyrimidine glycosylase/DNA-(apurinic or apyrimidinic site) lyase [Candidatus Omnitrophota bacterium]|nr:bifunctional DNA-formamidopyrimidine glycosylase/DNA-(apurinic or apyrimidinic site) lyase [Candidatus Omnitrophota bacterium]HPD84495.1 bifunctional DNA-formamidopyrimidine glycosylase/DNA-(apurinic or apyrimidinic site) lyase [Candidatus Omnitrophota bacterium]HRZ03353.1 bifunctional DNA-formamidopyrimidine glycosylase/DNA-(apurinic or apyrimidinic site) lyase [Candidatus Omnitrophota bacterium]
MPELPEVETIKRGLAKKIIGQTITGVHIKDRMVIGSGNLKKFISGVGSREIIRVERRGKAVIIILSGNGFLVIQLAMTGQLITGKELAESKVSLKLSGGKYLNYNDRRRLGRLSFVEDLKGMKFLRTLGPEPLSNDFNRSWLGERLKSKKAPIKSILMNQQFVAGIGNIYASEILFRSKINPLKAGCTLSDNEIGRLCRMTADVLREAIRLRGSSVDTYRDTDGKKGGFVNRIKVYGRDKKKCVLCGTPIERVVLSGRSTFFCKRCQH